MPDPPPNETDIEAVVRQVREAIESGRADAELRATKPIRDAAVKAIIDAERIDWEKVHRPTMTNSQPNASTASAVTLDSLMQTVQDMAEKAGAGI